MERDWESLLEELWGPGSSDPVELETRIRACLRGHSSEGLLQAISLLISQKQHSTARTLLSEFLRSHHAAHDIRRLLALILDCEPVRTVKTLSLESKQRSKEILLKDVNDLVAAGDLRAAETILLNASKSIDEPDYLSLLGRIYVLQERPLDAAKVVKGELLLRRQQRAFVEKVSVESEDDDLPTAGDLSYLNDFASSLASLEPSPATTSQSSTAVEKTLDFSQQASAQVPPFSRDDLGGYRVEWASVESSARAEQADAVDDLGATQRGADSSSVREITVESTPKKSILKLARPRKPVESGATQARVPIFKKPTRSLGGVRALASSSPAADTDGHPDLPPKTESSFESPQIHDGIFDEYDDLPHAYPEVDSTYLVQRGGSLEESEDETDFDHDLHDLTIIELGKEYEEDASIVLDDFRDLDDDYVAYAFDPDEVFDSQEIEGAESDSWLADTLSREDRALQKAAELISNADWPLSTLPLIQQIFVMSGWGATRLALAREIEKGLTPEELILAAHIKVMWAENDIYWIAFDKTGSSRLSYYVLSWPTALLIVRSFESLPQVEEIEVFLEHLFASWYENYTLRRVFKAFARYIWFRFANLEGCLPAKEHFDFCDPSELPAEEYSDLGLCDTLDIEMTARLRVYGVYQNKHPQEPSCYFSDKPIVAEEEPSLDASAKGKRVKRAPEATETELKAGDDTSWADDVDDEENSPQLSAALLAAAVNTQIADKPSTSIES